MTNWYGGKQVKIKCKACKHTFQEDFEILRYDYTTGTCCPLCGRDIEIEVSKEGILLVRTAGIDKDFEVQNTGQLEHLGA